MHSSKGQAALLRRDEEQTQAHFRVLGVDKDLPLFPAEYRSLAIVDHFLHMCGAEVTARVERADTGLHISFRHAALDVMWKVQNTMSAAEALVALDAMLRDNNIKATFPLRDKKDAASETAESGITELGAGTRPMLLRTTNQTRIVHAK